jgi:hypothetical protein
MLHKTLPTGLFTGLAGSGFVAPLVITLAHGISSIIPAGRYYLYATAADMDLEIVTDAVPTWTKIRDGADTSGLFMVVISDGASVRLRNSHAVTDGETASLIRIGGSYMPTGHVAGTPDGSFALPQAVSLVSGGVDAYVIPAGMYYLYATGADVDLEIVTDPVAPTWVKLRDGADAAPTPVGALIASDGRNVRLHHTGAGTETAQLIKVEGGAIPTGVLVGSPGSIFGRDTTITLNRLATLVIAEGWYWMFTDDVDMDLEVVTAAATPTWTKIRDGAETQPAGILFYSDGTNVRLRNSAAATDNEVAHLIKAA